jgi:putative MATE family efflux protein
LQKTSDLTLAAIAAPPQPAVSARTRRLLEGPILPTLLRLALPNVVVVVVQALSGAVDAFYLGRLGPEVLAGVALVFPVWMLMVTMAGGGVGGGISSSVARALGGGRTDDANGLVLHSLVLSAGLGLLFSALTLLGGPALYRAMGGSDGAVLDAALAYSSIVFGAALVVWMLNAFGSVLRGSGEMGVPAGVVVLGELLHVVLAPLFIFGLGLGVAGAALSLVLSYALRAAVLGGYVLAGRAAVRLPERPWRLRTAPFREILRVALPGSLNTLLTNANVMVITSLVSPAGVYALAGYGLASRLEYLQIPIVFGFGTALVTMVGSNVGAGRMARARRVCWVGGGLAAAATGAVGLVAAVFPRAWLGLFTADERVLAIGATYLHVVGPTFGFFGLGLALYFAAQGAGQMGWALAAGAGRVALGAGGGWVAVTWLGLGVEWLFAAVALAFVGYGLAQGLAVGWMTTGAARPGPGV